MKTTLLIIACCFQLVSALAQNSTSMTLVKNEVSKKSFTFQDYAKYAKRMVDNNEKRLALLKEIAARQEVSKRYKRAIKSLDIENQELIKDLCDYTNYGIGDWTLFQKEFNEELAPLRQDIAQIEKDFKTLAPSFENLIAANNNK